MLGLHRRRLHQEGLRPLEGQPWVSDTSALLLHDTQVSVCRDAVVMSGRLDAVNDHAAALRRRRGDLKAPRGCRESKAQSKSCHEEQVTKKIFCWMPNEQALNIIIQIKE